MITEKEKEKQTISRHAVILYAVQYGFNIKQIRYFFDKIEEPYSYKSMRTTYYRALKGFFPAPDYPKEIVKKLILEFDKMFLCTLDKWKVRERFVISNSGVIKNLPEKKPLEKKPLEKKSLKKELAKIKYA